MASKRRRTRVEKNDQQMLELLQLFSEINEKLFRQHSLETKFAKRDKLLDFLQQYVTIMNTDCLQKCIILLGIHTQSCMHDPFTIYMTQTLFLARFFGKNQMNDVSKAPINSSKKIICSCFIRNLLRAERK